MAARARTHARGFLRFRRCRSSIISLGGHHRSCFEALLRIIMTTGLLPPGCRVESARSRLVPRLKCHTLAGNPF
jgi:hypothetical protein